jgi:[ribosomal protein S5]-alanine N-acetyltransferase
LSALSEFAFSDLGFHRLELVHSVANQASCRVAAKVGYALEGTMRGQSPHDDGIHDAHLHARIASDA